MRLDRLEEKIVGYLEAKILNPQTAARIANKVHDQTVKALHLLEDTKRAARYQINEQAQERRQLSEEADRIIDAIAATGHSPKMLARLREIEWKMADLEQAASKQQPSIKFVAEELREYVMRSLVDIRALLNSNIQAAKTKLSQHIGELTFTPTHTEQGAAYEIIGEWNLLPEKKDVLVWAFRGTLTTRLGFAAASM
jgi:Mg2+ and Co2+ transporter CorA